LDLSGSMQGAGGVGGLLLSSWDVAVNAWQTAALVYDGNGNIASLADLSNGAVVGDYEYGPFGEPLRATGALAKVNPFRFSTKYEDNETGLLYYGYRYYQAGTGKWISRDPIEEEGGENLFGAVSNELISQIDYLGLAEVNVKLRRESYGYFATYGDITISSDNAEVTTCCSLPKTWNTIELPWGDFALRLGDITRPSAPRPFRGTSIQTDAGLKNLNKKEDGPRETTPNALAAAWRVKVPKPSGMTDEDYQKATTYAFNIGNGMIDVHAGNTSCNSLFCPIIGKKFKGQTLPPADRRHPFPNVTPEQKDEKHTAFGFDIEDSLKSQIEFNAAIICAEKKLGRKPTISFQVAPGKPKWAGGDKPPIPTRR